MAEQLPARHVLKQQVDAAVIVVVAHTAQGETPMPAQEVCAQTTPLPSPLGERAACGVHSQVDDEGVVYHGQDAHLRLDVVHLTQPHDLALLEDLHGEPLRPHTHHTSTSPHNHIS